MVYLRKDLADKPSLSLIGLDNSLEISAKICRSTNSLEYVDAGSASIKIEDDDQNRRGKRVIGR